MKLVIEDQRLIEHIGKLLSDDLVFINLALGSGEVSESGRSTLVNDYKVIVAAVNRLLSSLGIPYSYSVLIIGGSRSSWSFHFVPNAIALQMLERFPVDVKV